VTADGRQFLVSRRRDREEARRAGAPEALDRGYATGPRIGHSSTASLPTLPGEDGTVGLIRFRRQFEYTASDKLQHIRLGSAIRIPESVLGRR
jgi:hypothetical protein